MITDSSASMLPNRVEELLCEKNLIEEDFNVEMEQTSFVILVPNRLRVAVAVLTEVFTPAVLRIYYIYLKNQQLVVDNLRFHIFPTIVAFLANSISRSLASVQKCIISQAAIQENDDNIIDASSSSTSSSLEQSVDCQVLYTPETEAKHQADIIFIHGLHGGIDRTWKQGQWRHEHHHLKYQTPIHNNSTGEYHSTNTTTTSDNVANSDRDEDDGNFENYSKCWPQDWLLKDCPGCRVIALNYTTDVLWCPIWKKKRNRTNMVQRSDEMIEELCRLHVGDKPIIWVGHSKGGLFIKQIILNAWERRESSPAIYQIFNQSRAIMFYSVPHKGSSLADFTLPFLRRSVELIEIQRNCDFLRDLHQRFLKLCHDGHFNGDIFSFIETSFTLMSFVYLKIVAYDSADPGIGITCGVPLDHREICKPAGRDCFLYLELVKMIKKHINNNEN